MGLLPIRDDGFDVQAAGFEALRLDHPEVLRLAVGRVGGKAGENDNGHHGAILLKCCNICLKDTVGIGRQAVRGGVSVPREVRGRIVQIMQIVKPQAAG